MSRFARKVKNKIKENIYNIPNFLTCLRIIIAFIIIYFVFADFDIRYVITAFVIGMLTDFLDGQIARRFNLKTEFGRKADMIADRFLMIGTVLALIIKFNVLGLLTKYYYLQIFLVVIREIIALPFAIVLFTSGKDLPHAHFFGKAATVMQGITFPLILLSIFYPIFNFSIYFAVATAIIGIISAFTFINYVLKIEKEK